MPERDLYDILGVERGASADELKKAYRRLARKHHPDVNPGNKASEEKFKEVTAAFEVLGDPKRRSLYDEFGADSLRSGFDASKAEAYRQWRRQGAPRGARPEWGDFQEVNVGDMGSFDFASIFGDLFGGRASAPRGRRPAQQGAHAEAELEVDLRDAVLGAERDMSVGGKTLRVKIPAGVTDGSTIRLQGQGGPGHGGGGAGDLYLRVKLKEHELVRREGKDLYLDLPVTVPEAILGGPVTLPTFEGSVELRLPAHTQAGKKLRLRGKGLPDLRGGERGDLYAVVRLVLPERATGLEKLARALADHYKGDPRAHLTL